VNDPEMRHGRKTSSKVQDGYKAEIITGSHLTRHGGRQGRYVGTQKTDWQIIMASINHNIKKVMAYLIKKPKLPNTGVLCPISG